MVVLIAMFVDKVVGDPQGLPHPVIFIGRWISYWERKWNLAPYSSHPRTRLALGACLTFLTVGLSWFIPFLVLHWIYHIQRIVWMILNIWLISTTIAWKGLADAGKSVYHALTQQGLEAARIEVAMIVGRDTEHLSESEVIRATVETVAENIVDAIVSPVFFGVLGGAPLALAFRAANTLDSMVGYRNERYFYFGRASARLDDVLNYLPARLTIILLSAAVYVSRLSLKGAWNMLRRDSPHHPSPNAGIPESMVAGALSVRLGGTNFYQGVVSERATMGDSVRPLSSMDILTTMTLMHRVSWYIVILIGLMIGGGLLCQNGCHF
ncbi:adenosylcobinamide-phosphate synthase CbiB [Alicyclobacillus sp. SO9]|uniref:adenosylcobinamide-phosphate synthase CbiB n=1 Tax=Alicyclobacillus sp. SO9 TaxID=2665646 RepID=UPI0018E6ECD9|nr:cobalamin biosynthesis protein CobD [Alicyclobacillus sp. SO9]